DYSDKNDEELEAIIRLAFNHLSFPARDDLIEELNDLGDDEGGD
ncbi:hypothetical protein LCGC14_2672360, partial [marine sediment metagenome]